MIELRTIRQPLRTLNDAVMDCYLRAIRDRDFERASWIARNFNITLPVTFNVASMRRTV